MPLEPLLSPRLSIPTRGPVEGVPRTGLQRQLPTNPPAGPSPCMRPRSQAGAQRSGPHNGAVSLAAAQTRPKWEGPPGPGCAPGGEGGRPLRLDCWWGLEHPCRPGQAPGRLISSQALRRQRGAGEIRPSRSESGLPLGAAARKRPLRGTGACPPLLDTCPGGQALGEAVPASRHHLLERPQPAWTHQVGTRPWSGPPCHP